MVARVGVFFFFFFFKLIDLMPYYERDLHIIDRIEVYIHTHQYKDKIVIT